MAPAGLEVDRRGTDDLSAGRSGEDVDARTGLRHAGQVEQRLTPLLVVDIEVERLRGPVFHGHCALPRG
jgi:hypothetical protein